MSTETSYSFSADLLLLFLTNPVETKHFSVWGKVKARDTQAEKSVCLALNKI